MIGYCSDCGEQIFSSKQVCPITGAYCQDEDDV